MCGVRVEMGPRLVIEDQSSSLNGRTQSLELFATPRPLQEAEPSDFGGVLRL